MLIGNVCRHLNCKSGILTAAYRRQKNGKQRPEWPPLPCHGGILFITKLHHNSIRNVILQHCTVQTCAQGLCPWTPLGAMPPDPLFSRFALVFTNKRCREMRPTRPHTDHKPFGNIRILLTASNKCIPPALLMPPQLSIFANFGGRQDKFLEKVSSTDDFAVL